MPAFPRPLFLFTHAAALAVGCWFAWPRDERPVSVAEASAKEAPTAHRPAPAKRPTSSEVSDAPTTPRDFAVAWEILRRRPLPREERQALLRGLLGQWSVVDLEAALRATFEEFSYNPKNPSWEYVEVCAPGLLANPDLALQLIRDRTLGLDTVHLRAVWTRLMLEHQPERVIAAFPGMKGDDRAYTLESFADRLVNPDTDPFAEMTNFPAQEATLATVLSHIDVARRENEIRLAAAQLSGTFTPAQLKLRMESATDPVLRSLYLSAFAQSLSTDDPFAFDETSSTEVAAIKHWQSLPAALRSEVAAEALYGEDCSSELILAFTQQAHADGNLDALKAAVENDSFGRMADNTEQPIELAEWALTLPEDPRTAGLYLRVLQGASVRDFPGVRDRVLALPSGSRRDEGLAALAYGGHYSDQPAAEIEQLLQQIRNPEVKARAMAEYRENQASDDE
jgi:hypothetical protein